MKTLNACKRIALALALATLALMPPPAAIAQPAPGHTAEPSVAVPGFWDPRRRPERPDTSRISQIRFLTEFDYPPFNYAGPDGNPAGFNVELARLIGVSGSVDDLAAVAKAYRVYYKKVPLKDGDYTMDHTAIVYLMDKTGAFVAPFSLKRRPEEAAADLRKYF